MRHVSAPFATAWLVFASSFSLAACSDPEQKIADTGFTDEALIVDFADEVVVPTYALLRDRAGDVHTAVQALATTPGTATLTAAQDAWVAARIPWEQSEGCLFGPVDTFGYDPALDSWPVNRTDLDAVMASSDALTPTFVGNLDPELKGFHTLEYILFGQDRTRVAAELTARELEFAVGLAAELESVATALHDSWTVGGAGLPPYRDTFATAGEAGNTAYPSLAAAAQEIIGGMIGICDEVANGKIADPYDHQDPELVESQFSFNSLDDFMNNIRSVQNAYHGDVPAAGSTGRGLAEWLAERDADLAAHIEADLAASLSALEAIPEPFRDAIRDPSAAANIEVAQAAIRDLQTTLESQLLPLVLE